MERMILLGSHRKKIFRDSYEAGRTDGGSSHSIVCVYAQIFHFILDVN